MCYEFFIHFLCASDVCLKNFFQTSFELVNNTLQTSQELLSSFFRTSYKLLNNYLQTSYEWLTDFLFSYSSIASSLKRYVKDILGYFFEAKTTYRNFYLNIV